MRDETESISVFRSSYMSVLATSREKLYSTLTLRRQNFWYTCNARQCMHWREGGGGGGLGWERGAKRDPSAGNLFEQFNQFNQARTEWKTGSITLVIEKLNVQIDWLFILSHCKLWHQRRRCMLSHDRSQIQLLLYQIWNKKQKQNAENLRHKNTVKQCVLEISFKLGNFAS